MSHSLFELLATLEEARVSFTLGRFRHDTVLVTLTLAGERVEIDVFEDGRMEVARFLGSEGIVGDQQLVLQLIRENAGSPID
ncbi:hypothetical protein R0381_001831 [Jeongeupia wiesaeckerbachi]|uniref:hypothetical protein n=1 Tax=Jeongeupia wiesaeckerbachi TaxID=3051218 RepID=UPI003D804A9B